MTTNNKTNNKTVLTTRQAIGYIGAGITALVGFVPLGIRVLGGVIEEVDDKFLDNSLRDDRMIDLGLGQARVHDQIVKTTKNYAIDMFKDTTIKSKSRLLLDEDEEVIVTPSKTKAEEVKKDESIFNN